MFFLIDDAFRKGEYIDIGTAKGTVEAISVRSMKLRHHNGPLKSQGVIQMTDSAMIVRVKFMTRPGDQRTLRNKVLAHIRDLFEREEIKFAHREVTVRIADENGAPGDARSEAAAAARAVVEEEVAAAPAADDR